MQSSATESAVDSVMLALMSVGRVMRQRFDGERLDPGTFWLLKQLHHRGAMRATDLAAVASLDVSTVSRHVAQLEKSGLVGRTPDPDDGRAQRVELTDAGRQALADAFEQRRALIRRSLAGWPAADVAELDRLLGRFVRTLETTTTELELA